MLTHIKYSLHAQATKNRPSRSLPLPRLASLLQGRRWCFSCCRVHSAPLTSAAASPATAAVFAALIQFRTATVPLRHCSCRSAPPLLQHRRRCCPRAPLRLFCRTRSAALLLLPLLAPIVAPLLLLPRDRIPPCRVCCTPITTTPDAFADAASRPPPMPLCLRATNAPRPAAAAATAHLRGAVTAALAATVSPPSQRLLRPSQRLLRPSPRP
jgi:hypothetical protein